jgi:GTP-binding protein EngB required for normal cell division
MSKELSEKEVSKLIQDYLIDNIDIKELMELGKKATEKYEVDHELYEFFHRKVVEVDNGGNKS